MTAIHRHLLHCLAAIVLVCCALTLPTACVEEEEMPNTPSGNFEALWRIIDEHYCFFDYKKAAIGLDWNEVHARYAPRFNDNMSRLQMFAVLCNMLSELRAFTWVPTTE